MFAPDVYSTFRGMSEGSTYRGEVSTNYDLSSFPYSIRGSDEYRGTLGEKTPVIEQFFKEMKENNNTGELEFIEYIRSQASKQMMSFREYLTHYDRFPFLFLEKYTHEEKRMIIENLLVLDFDKYIQEFVNKMAEFNEIPELDSEGNLKYFDKSGSVDKYAKWLKSEVRTGYLKKIMPTIPDNRLRTPMAELRYHFKGQHMQTVLRENKIQYDKWDGIMDELIEYFAKKYKIPNE